jgi:hypothetical protein
VINARRRVILGVFGGTGLALEELMDDAFIALRGPLGQRWSGDFGGDERTLPAVGIGGIEDDLVSISIIHLVSLGFKNGGERERK